MTEFLKKAESWNEKFKLSTQMVRDIPPETILTNGWDKKKLYIHLYARYETWLNLPDGV